MEQSSLALRSLIAAGDRIPGQLDQRFAEIGMFYRERQRETARFMAGVGWAKDRHIFDVTADFTEAVRDVLKYLQAHDGDWTAQGKTIRDVRWQTMDEVRQYIRLRDRMVDSLRTLLGELRKAGAYPPPGTPPAMVPATQGQN
jgi:hypothetical protein